jgi:hypothetical protein
MGKHADSMGMATDRDRRFQLIIGGAAQEPSRLVTRQERQHGRSAGWRVRQAERRRRSTQAGGPQTPLPPSAA